MYVRKTQASKRTCRWKSEGYLIVFSDICNYSSLMEHQNLASGSFRKVSCEVESALLSMKYLSPVTLKSMRSILQFEWLFHPGVMFLGHILVTWAIMIH